METEIVNGKIFGVETVTRTKKMKVSISELRNYLLTHGFKQDGVWYFRKSWMKSDSFRLFRNAGLVEKVGTANSLKNKGIDFPHNGKYDVGEKGYSTMLIYKVIDDEINSLIPLNN